MKIKDLKPLEKNPFRGKGDEQLQHIAKSIQEFEKMMSIRKIVIDETNTVLGGNKRFFALKSLGYNEIPDEWIDKCTDLTEIEKQRFIVTDNAHFGSDWDFDMLRDIENTFNVNVEDWGVDFSNKCNIENTFSNIETEGFKMKYPITFIASEDEYNEWVKIKNELKIEDDTKALFHIFKNQIKC